MLLSTKMMIKVTPINITVFTIKFSGTQSCLGILGPYLSSLNKASVQGKYSQRCLKNTLVFHKHFWDNFLIQIIIYYYHLVFHAYFLNLSILSKIRLSFQQLFIKTLLVKTLYIHLIQLVKSCLVVLVLRKICTLRFFVHHFSKKLKSNKFQ